MEWIAETWRVFGSGGDLGNLAMATVVWAR